MSSSGYSRGGGKDHGVAYVPGAPFFPAGGGEEAMRLNFVSPPLAEIDGGVARLATAIGR
ncbi:MAG: hypothetical protein ACREJ7_02520 [Candidatus Methylomirabilales bacterium]